MPGVCAQEADAQLLLVALVGEGDQAVTVADEIAVTVDEAGRRARVDIIQLEEEVEELLARSRVILSMRPVDAPGSTSSISKKKSKCFLLGAGSSCR